MMLLDINKIRIDRGTQARSKIYEDRVSHYAMRMQEGDVFPPLTVNFDGLEYDLIDGFHRYHAIRRINRNKKNIGAVKVEVVNGTLRDAQWYALGANRHGMPMSNADKRANVIKIIDDVEWGLKNDSEIARHCDVSHTFVAKVRKELNKATKAITYTTSTGNQATRSRSTKTEETAETKEETQPVTKETDKATEEEENYDPQQEVFDHLTKENEKLKDQLAVGVAEDKEHTAKLIADLREENKLLKVEVKTLKASRDMYQAENAQLKKQVAMLQRKAA